MIQIFIIAELQGKISKESRNFQTSTIPTFHYSDKAQSPKLKVKEKI